MTRADWQGSYLRVAITRSSRAHVVHELDRFVSAFPADEGMRRLAVEAWSDAGITDLTPRAPVRFYYGSQDLDVIPREALVGAEQMRARGADARAVDVGPLGHDASMLAAAPLIFAWLGELEAAESATRR